MTPEQQTVLMIKGAIQELPPELKEACDEVSEHLRRVVKQAGPVVGTMAISLVGAELQLVEVTK